MIRPITPMLLMSLGWEGTSGNDGFVDVTAFWKDWLILILASILMGGTVLSAGVAPGRRLSSASVIPSIGLIGEYGEYDLILHLRRRPEAGIQKAPGN